MALRVHKSMTVHLHHVVCTVHAQTARTATTVCVTRGMVANIVKWISMNALHCHVPMVEPVVNQLLVLTSVSVKMAGMETTVLWM